MNCQRLAAVILPLAILSACTDDKAPEEGKLSGEVLEGTISDEMLPLDRVKSQAPLASPSETANAAVEAEESGSAAAETTPEARETPVTTTDGQTG